MKYSDKLTSGQSRRAFTLLLCCFAAAGIIAGSVYGASAAGEPAVWLHQYFIPEQGSGAVLSTMKHSFISSALFIAAAYFSGLFAFGQPLGLLLVIYRGFGIGLSSAQLYLTSGGGAVVKVLVLILPKGLAAVFISVLASRELMRASYSVLRLWLSGEVYDDKLVDLKRYSLKYAVLILLSVLMTLTDGAVNLIYSKVS